MTRDNISDERFIHDALLRQAEGMVNASYDIWRRDRVIPPHAFAWPSTRIKTDAGEPHEGICALELPANEKDRPEAVRALLQRTQAYAMFVIEQSKDEVRAILESPHGARCWKIPIERHGDVRVLGKLQHRDNVENMGLLWRPNQARA